MVLLSIDPGTRESAFVLFQTKDEAILSFSIVNNEILLKQIRSHSFIYQPEKLVIESIEGFGIPSGQETFDTCFWSGRFCQAFRGEFERVGRKAIKSHLCGTTRAQDKDVRAAIIYRFGDPGSKKVPGKLYGISSHCWAALALAVYAADKLNGR